MKWATVHVCVPVPCPCPLCLVPVPCPLSLVPCPCPCPVLTCPLPQVRPGCPAVRHGLLPGHHQPLEGLRKDPAAPQHPQEAQAAAPARVLRGRRQGAGDRGDGQGPWRAAARGQPHDPRRGGPASHPCRPAQEPRGSNPGAQHKILPPHPNT